jgi:ubiquinone biosynthesis protein UbiJ
MKHALNDMLAPAAVERLTLLINHVLGREPAAMQRLQPHAGSVVALDVQDWPAVLPPWPALVFRITPAGLLEWCRQASHAAPDLQVRVQASNPALLVLGALSGQAPAVHVEGDARLAAEASWLLEHLRWDLADDLHRLLGPGPAQLLSRLGPALAQALARLAPQAVELLSRCAAAFGGAAGPGDGRGAAQPRS